ncbi:MAG: tetratricopeptide repeat protein [Gammaproteobacteria bacterium]|nr:tetratricopeptide repeat protein [Gammaproteobacteria bacterium]
MESTIAEQVVAALGLTPYTRETTYRNDPSTATLDAHDYYLLGRFHKMDRNQQSLEKALEMFQTSVDLQPELPAAYRGVASVNLLLSFYGDIPLARAVETALPNLERALALDPDDEEIYGTMGLARYMLGEYGVAEEMLRQALSINDNYAIAWMWRGMVQEKQGRLNKAIEYYQLAARLEPLSVVVMVNRSMALQEAGRHEQAMSSLREIEDRGLSSVQYHRTLSRLFLENGELAAAYRAIQRALEISPTDQISNSQLALVLKDLGRHEESLAIFERSLENNLPGRGALEYLARVHIRLNAEERNRANQYLGALFPIDHSIPEILWRRQTAFLGPASMYSGNYKQSIELLESALRATDSALDNADHDLVYCTALAFSRQQTGEESDHWIQRCEQALNNAKKQGWNNHWTDYARIQLNMLRGRYSEAMEGLIALFGKEVTAAGVLSNDPILAPIRQRPAFESLIEQVNDAAAKAWQEVSARHPLGSADQPASQTIPR